MVRGAFCVFAGATAWCSDSTTQSFERGLLILKKWSYLDSGVRVFSALNLHAKVFVFGPVAAIGSSNVSVASERLLIEAVVETRAPSVVRAAREFVRSLCGDEITPEYAQSKIGLFRPPRRPAVPTGAVVQQSTVWALVADYVDWDEDDEATAKAERPSAVGLLEDPQRYRVEMIAWHGSARMKAGDRAVFLTRSNGRTLVSPPGRILSVRRYLAGRRAMLAIELRKRLHERPLRTVLKRLGREGRPLRGIRYQRKLNARAASALGRMWVSQA